MAEWLGKSAAVVALATLIKQIEMGHISPEEMIVDFGEEEVIPETHTGMKEFRNSNMRTFTLIYCANGGE